MSENKELQKARFQCGVSPTKQDMESIIDNSLTVLSNILQLPTPTSFTLGHEYLIGNTIYRGSQRPDLSFFWDARTFGGGGVTDFLNLTSRPGFNNRLLAGDVNNDPLDFGIMPVLGLNNVRPEMNDRIYLLRGIMPFMVRFSDFLTLISNEQIIFLEDITNVPPVIVDATVGRTRYFNTAEGLIFAADSPTTWNPQGNMASEIVIYVNNANNQLYRFEGGAMVSFSGGGGIGSKWLGGSGTPSNSFGNIGDWYINTATADIYEKTGATTWTLRLNIKGKDSDVSLDKVNELIKQHNENHNSHKYLLDEIKLIKEHMALE